jgi:hypothetical protein
MATPYVLAALLAVAIPWQLLRAYRSDDRAVDRWALDHGLELTPESRPVVRHYLRRARILRTWGAVAGAVLPSVIEYAATGRVQVLASLVALQDVTESRWRVRRSARAGAAVSA